jgi:protein-tyrosine phosphatase
MTPPARSAGALIPLDGTMNLRDLGGWSAAGGMTAFGCLYRSDRLSDLSDADHRQLERREITTVIDLRRPAEVAEYPSRLWSSVVDHHQIPIGGHSDDARTFLQRVLDGELDAMSNDDVGENYVELLDTHGHQFGQAVEAMLAPGASLFHCSAGKDRTGLLSMLVLSSVGVSDEDIVEDYTLSNRYRTGHRIEHLRAVFEANGLDIDRYRPILSAPGPAMAKAMAWLSNEFGSPERYLAQRAGVVDPAPRLRELLVVSAERN